MADIFISYKREDRPAAERLSIALEQLGFDVWWDFELLSGERYRDVIRAVIDQCKASIVLWSVRAVESDFVMDEATYSKARGKLCPARIDSVELPFGFGQIQTDDLTDWDGELSHSGFSSLVRAIEARVGRKGKLGAAPRTPQSQALTSELEAFKAAQIANNPSALRTFLRDHPRGAFASFVRGQLQTMGAEARVTAAAAAGANYAEPPPAPPSVGSSQSHAESAGAASRGAAPWPLITGALGLIAVVAIAFAVLPRTAPKAPDATVDTNTATPTATNTATSTATPAFTPYDLNALNPQVRAAVEQARRAEVLANAAAERARDAAQAAQDSAQRARNGEAGYRAETLTWGSPARTGRYETGFSGGARNGYGLLTVIAGPYIGDVYAGRFSNSQYAGPGVYTYAQNPNNTGGWLSYEGEWSNDAPNGVGVYTWRNGMRYVGGWRSSSQWQRSGPGVLYWPDGRRHEGEWSNTRNGYGVEWDGQGHVSQQGIYTNDVLTTPLSR